MSDNTQNEVFDVNNIPDDASVDTSPKKEFEPLEDGMYQVQVLEIELKQNYFWKPDKPEDGDKYVFSFTFVILNEEDRGRRIWDTFGLYFKPDGSRGPTKLYKVITKTLGMDMSWDDCQAFSPDLKTLYQNVLSEVKGKQLQVVVETTKKAEGKHRTKIVSYMSTKSQLPTFDPEEMKKKDSEDEPKKESEYTSDEIADDIPF